MIHLDSVRRSIDQVHHIIEPGSQEVNVLPVQRGDEHSIQPGDYFVGDLVCLMFQPLDRIDDGVPADRIGPE